MNKKSIKPPVLSTGFSESGKRAKMRFDNILNTKAKKTGALAFVLILLLVGALGIFIGINSGKSISYASNTLGCSFELPKSWENKYEIKERNNIVYVYHKAIRQEYGEGTGLLFYIEMLRGGNLTHEDITDPGNRSIALQEGGFTYVFGMPTDIQYPIWEGGDKALADDYLKMTKDHQKIKESIRRTARSENGLGTAIITKDTGMFSDIQGIDISYNLKKNDLVYVIYDQNEDYYYAQAAVFDIPVAHGYVPKDAVSFDAEIFNNANYGTVKSGIIYKSANESDIYDQNYINLFYITRRQGEWAEVNLAGGDSGKWVKASDISYELIPHGVDLSYTGLQREVDDGHQPWRLDPLEVARDYAYNTLNKKGGEFEVYYADEAAPSISYTYKEAGEKEIRIVVYKPVKKDQSGIWVVHTGTLIESQIQSAIPADRQIVVNSGMAWQINVAKNMSYSDPKGKITFDLEQEAKKFGIDISAYYGRDLTVFIYEVETANHISQKYSKSPYIFVFEGASMIAYRDLESEENERIARDIMIALSKHKNAD